MKKRLIIVCALALALMSLSPGARPRGQAGEGMSLIRLRLTAPGGEPIRACVVAGGMLRITDHKAGTTYAYFPTVLDEKRGAVSVKVYRVDESDAGESLEEVEAVEASFGSAKTTARSPAYSIEVEAIGRSAAKAVAKRNAVGVSSLDDEAGQCCVTCDGITACSNCTVNMSCGSCCTGDPKRPACACGPIGINP